MLLWLVASNCGRIRSQLFFSRRNVSAGVVQGVARSKLYAWDAANVENMLNNSAPVCAVFNGHDHRGGYSVNQGVHYIAIEAVLESPEDSTAYAFVDLFSEELVITGFGTVSSRKCDLR